MEINEKDKFAKLMAIMGELSSGTEKDKRPSITKINFYFDALKQLSYKQIEKNAYLHFQKNKWFPAICELIGNTDEQIEVEAIQAFDIIKGLMENFYCQELGSAGRQAIIIELESMGKKELIPILDKWGYEIASGNTQVVRAQFLKSFKANKIIDANRRLDAGKEPKQLGRILERRLNK